MATKKSSSTKPKAEIVTTDEPDTITAELTEHTPEFATARAHKATVDTALRTALGAGVALGCELRKLKESLGVKHGNNGGELSSPPTPWKMRVSSETGLTYEWSNKLIKTADAILETLKGKRTPEAKHARKILLDPPAEWSEADYQAVTNVAAAVYNAESLRELMIETGIIPRPKDPGANLTNRGGKGNPQLDPIQAAQHHFLPSYRIVSHLVDTDAAKSRLYDLPLRAEDPTKEVGLLDLQSALKSQLTAIEEVVTTRQKGSN